MVGKLLLDLKFTLINDPNLVCKVAFCIDGLVPLKLYVVHALCKLQQSVLRVRLKVLKAEQKVHKFREPPLVFPFKDLSVDCVWDRDDFDMAQSPHSKPPQVKCVIIQQSELSETDSLPEMVHTGVVTAVIILDLATTKLELVSRVLIFLKEFEKPVNASAILLRVSD